MDPVVKIAVHQIALLDVHPDVWVVPVHVVVNVKGHVQIHVL